MRKPLPEMSKTDRMNYMFGIDAMEMVEQDLMDVMWDHAGCPKEWHEVWEDQDKRDVKRQRCTVSFDADVVKFFKAMGPGYQPRMNRVLRAFMYFRLAKIVRGADTTDFVTRPEEVEAKAKAPRTQWGDAEAGIHRRSESFVAGYAEGVRMMERKAAEEAKRGREVLIR